MNCLIRTAAVLTLATGSWVISGCGTKDDWMPMRLSQSWTYRVTGGFDRHTVPVTVVRELTVAGVPGYELSGPLGVSRLAWKSGVLVADTTANARFVPPIPLLIPGVELSKKKAKNVAKWHGRAYVLGVEMPASAELTEMSATIEIGIRKVPTILSTLTLKLPRGSIELESWFQSGVGLVQQEQRTKGTRIVQLTIVNRS